MLIFRSLSLLDETTVTNWNASFSERNYYYLQTMYPVVFTFGGVMCGYFSLSQIDNEN